MPPAAPATRSVFRSVLDSRKSCAIIDPKAPPVMMMGPSAPNGPPEPIEIALESGFRMATLGSTLLPLMRMASMASGMPWPRIRSEPYRAMKPMMSAPATGTSTSQSPRWLAAGEAMALLQRWKKNRLVNNPINLSRAMAMKALDKPIGIPRPEIFRTRGVMVKSPKSSAPAAWTG